MDRLNRTVSRLLAGAALICFGLSLPCPAAQAQEHVSTLPGDPLRGIKLFVEKNCVECHTVWGAGGDAFGPDLAQVASGRSFYQLVGLLWSHSPKMVEIMESKGLTRPDLSAEDMSDIISYLYYLNFFDPAGDPAEGAASFTDMGCATCHQVGGRGGTYGPPLDPFARKMSPIFMAAEMWNHAGLMKQGMKRRSMRLPVFEGREIADILAYIRSEATGKSAKREYMKPGNPIKGEELFTSKKCSACHAVWGKGGDIAGDLGQERLYRSVSEVAGIMWNHSGEMTAALRQMSRGTITFTAEEMNHLLTYIYFLNFVDEPGSADAGRAIFNAKACSACHTAEPGDEKLGPNLAISDSATSPMKLASRMWEHAPRMAQMLDDLGLSWPQFAGDEMRDLVAFLQAQRKAVEQER